MIPNRIQMSGFLSYKDAQEVRFDGAPLWMLAGTNGSGKSSIFDGVTYALFGHHRGGSQNAAELINKDSSSLSVEFDFKLDGELFRIKRTLRRNAKGAVSGTQQIFQETHGSFEAVPDTGKKVDFDKWIHDKIGLNYETFTSSVLLLQGKAEKLLDARPSGRAEVLAGIVDLERYQRLHERANARKLEWKSKLDALSHQTAAVPEVTDLEYLEATNRIEEALESRTQTQSRIDALSEQEIQARRWTELQTRLAHARHRLSQAESLMSDAVKIEKAYGRMQELRDVLPVVHTVVTLRAQVLDSERKTQHYQTNREEAQTRKATAEHDLVQARASRTTVQKQLERDEQKHQHANTRLRELEGLLEKIRVLEQQEAVLKGLEAEATQFPQDLDATLRSTQEEADRLSELDRILPILERFQTERHELGAARQLWETARRDQQRIQTEGEHRKAEHEKLKPEVEQSKQDRIRADQHVAVTKARVEQTRAAVEDLATLSGEQTCRACGQTLTAEHFAEEQARRVQERITAEEQLREAEQAAHQSARHEQELSNKQSVLRADLDRLRDAFLEQRSLAKQAESDVKRLQGSLALRYAEMPEPFKSRISPTVTPDWSMTTYPERDELIGLRRDVAGLELAKRRLKDRRDQLSQFQQLLARIDTARQALTRIRTGMSSIDPVALREEQQRLLAEETALIHAIRAAKQNLIKADTEIDKLGRESHAAIQALTDLAGKLNTEEVTRKHCADSIGRDLRKLPDNWRTTAERSGLTEYSEWKSELDQLIVDGVEQYHKQLEQARGGLNTLRLDIAELEAQAEQYPLESRRTPDLIRDELTLARQELERRDANWHDAQQQKALLDNYRSQRARLGDQFKVADAQHNRYKLLSELLGRDRLQRHLVRQAERQIVDYANAVLDRLSGGQLYLKLIGAEDGAAADRALDLEAYNRVTGGAPINVAFLSGSQRFRVAVALALGIGQYASRQHRPIESVIIDEGFGCLDRQGRQVMIQELQNLRGHLHCILLVSHQEEFADAFPDGYRFELQNGSTRVSRFVR